MSVKKFGIVINSLDDLAHSKETQLIVPLDWDLFGRFFVSINSCAYNFTLQSTNDEQSKLIIFNF